MTACLRCDGCSKAVAEHEADLRQWWRLTRYGVDWAEEPNAPKVSSPVVALQSVFLDSSAMSIMDIDSDSSGDEEVDVDEFMEFIDEDEPSIAILHFCSAACLASWSVQASAVED